MKKEIKHKVLKLTKKDVILVCRTKAKGQTYCSNWYYVTCPNCLKKKHVRKK